MFSVVLGNVRDVGERLTVGVGVVALPLSAIEPATLPAMLTEALRLLPAAVGLKPTVIEHVALIASPAPQVLVSENEEALVPVIEIPLMVRAAVPVFLTLTA